MGPKKGPQFLMSLWPQLPSLPTEILMGSPELRRGLPSSALEGNVPSSPLGVVRPFPWLEHSWFRRPHPELGETAAGILGGPEEHTREPHPHPCSSCLSASVPVVWLLCTVTQSCLQHLGLLASRLNNMTSVGYQVYLFSPLGRVLACPSFRIHRGWGILHTKRDVSWGGSGAIACLRKLMMALLCQPSTNSIKHPSLPPGKAAVTH